VASWRAESSAPVRACSQPRMMNIQLEPFSESDLDKLWELVVSQSTVVSIDTARTLVTNRRGTAVWRAQYRGNSWSVKCAGAMRSVAKTYAMESIVREGLVLSDVKAIGQGYLIESGQASNSDWTCAFLICTWIEGPSALRELLSSKPQVHREGGEALAMKLVPAIYAAVAPLHDAGWAHGDLQPDHFRWHDEKLSLMDFGLSQSLAHPMPGYRGGLVHFNAPEVCRDILSYGEAVATPQTDVFALASIVYFGITGTVLGSYSLDDSWEHKVKTLASGKYRSDPVEAFQSLPSAFSSFLMDCLELDPSQRPSSASAIPELSA